MLEMLAKAGWLDEGAASISADPNGIGTREEEKGVAPAEKGTLGLLFSVRLAEPAEKEVWKEPANKREEGDEGEFVIE
jgi:hypothetical protein